MSRVAPRDRRARAFGLGSPVSSRYRTDRRPRVWGREVHHHARRCHAFAGQAVQIGSKLMSALPAQPEGATQNFAKRGAKIDGVSGRRGRDAHATRMQDASASYVGSFPNGRAGPGQPSQNHRPHRCSVRGGSAAAIFRERVARRRGRELDLPRTRAAATPRARAGSSTGARWAVDRASPKPQAPIVLRRKDGSQIQCGGSCIRRADLPLMNRGDAAAATWIFLW